MKAFAAGAAAIPFALLAETIISCALTYSFVPAVKPAQLLLNPVQLNLCASARPPLHDYAFLAGPLMLAGFAAAEEVIKYISARRFVLRGTDFDEPVDAMIYLITVALGFAAFENIFFLVPAFGSTLFEGFLITNLRFLGATLLHAVSSGVVGYAVALTFYRHTRQTWYVSTGLFCATALHMLFNVIVVKSGNAGFGQALIVLVLTSMFLIFAFDRAKKIKRAARFPQIFSPAKNYNIQS